MAGKAVFRKVAKRFGSKARAKNYLYGDSTKVKVNQEFSHNGKTYIMTHPPEKGSKLNTSGPSGLGRFNLKFKNTSKPILNMSLKHELTQLVSN
ncbi:hypothetical protein [Candidatus Venteria ishoeyi]|uniref:Uncharacterized protein n=1 Tax=Candidatus Venteria ishoeyi TaxID=1899563 RepID=A0A1H6F7Y7_9GAMM|nr:hypothetical protein [Candidatus Venteria ishoeyi]SEH05511.1 Uncharacterised protein [Candidatus Venteria ishoeyi]